MPRNRDLIESPRKCLDARAVSCLLAAVVLIVSSQVLYAEKLPVRTYTIADGLLRDSVTRVVQDSRGALWFCTADGVSRFDGYGFLNFTTDDGLPERHVNDVLEMGPETIFLATGGGLARLNPRGVRGSADNPLFSVFVAGDDRGAKSFRRLLAQGSETFLAATDVGLYRVRLAAAGTVAFEHIPIDGAPALARPEVTAIFRDHDGVVWVGSFGWIARIEPDGRTTTFGTEGGVPKAGVTTILKDPGGQMWAGMRDFGGLLLLDANARSGGPLVRRVVTKDHGLPSSWVSDIRVVGGGRVLLATPAGVCEWKGGEKSVCRQLFREDKDRCEYAGIHEDEDGNLWLASNCGAKRVARHGFTAYGLDDGLGHTFPDSVFETAAGDLIVSARSTSRWLSRFDGERFEIVKLLDLPVVKNSYGWGWKQTALEDTVGDWWVATGPALLRYRRPKSFSGLASVVPERMGAGAWEGEPFRIYEDARGDVWVGTLREGRYGLARWRRSSGEWEDLTHAAGIRPADLVSGFLEDRAGNLWIATGIDNGREALLVRYRDGKFRAFTEREGVPPGWMRDIYLDSKGQIWLANTSVGLLRLLDPEADDKLEFAVYGRAAGLASNGIYCVVEDNFGRIYAGSGRGIDRLDLSTGTVQNFTAADGLPSNQVEIALKDRHGDLWFAAPGGIARLRPEPPPQREAPRMMITAVRAPAGAVTVPISILGESSVAPVQLDAHTGGVSVDFVGLGATLGEKLRYEYRLAGAEWTPTRERTINIADLNAGEFVLEVRAITADGLASAAATVGFSVAAPVWQRWWFLLLLSIAGGAAVYLLYRARVSRLIQFERMRTRIATDLHDDIGANLTRISLLSEVAKQKAVNGDTDLLTSIADISRESVASMNDIVWAVSPDHDRLVDLVRRMRSHAEEIFTLRDIDLDFSAPAADGDLQLSVGVRRDLLLIFKEAVNNAARHSACTSVKIELQLSSSLLTLAIADNGSGFAVIGYDGQGLRSMKRRAAALGGKLEIKSVIDMGTTIRFEIPLGQASVV